MTGAAAHSHMITVDLRVLCAALGLTTAMAQGDSGAKEAAFRARGFARIIEEFCRATVPEAFQSEDSVGKFAVAERMADAIAQIYQENGGCLPQDLNQKGFRPEEVDRYWAMANALAHVKLNIMDS